MKPQTSTVAASNLERQIRNQIKTILILAENDKPIAQTMESNTDNGKTSWVDGRFLYISNHGAFHVTKSQVILMHEIQNENYLGRVYFGSPNNIRLTALKRRKMVEYVFHPNAGAGWMLTELILPRIPGHSLFAL